MSFSFQERLLKIHICHSVTLAYKGCTFAGDRSIINGSLHEVNSTSVIYFIPLRDFPQTSYLTIRPQGLGQLYVRSRPVYNEGQFI